MKKYVVTGSTGCLGMALCRLFKNDSSCDVIGLGRNLQLGSILEQSDIEFRNIELNQKHALKEAFKNADAIFHCAALSAPWGTYQDFYETNVLWHTPCDSSSTSRNSFNPRIFPKYLF